jgi:predicted GIY-YIG superfamily endonuclease
VELAYYEKCENRASAMRREQQLKRKSHVEKEALATEFALNHE